MNILCFNMQTHNLKERRMLKCTILLNDWYFPPPKTLSNGAQGGAGCVLSNLLFMVVLHERNSRHFVDGYALKLQLSSQ